MSNSKKNELMKDAEKRTDVIFLAVNPAKYFGKKN